MNSPINGDYESCSDTSISSAEWEDSPWQQSNWGEYRQLSLWKSIPTHNSSSNTTSPESPSTQTSETINQTQESLTSSQWDSPAPAQVTQEVEQDYLTQHHHSGEKDLDALSKLNPASVLLNNLKELSDEDLELFLPPSIWQDTLARLKQSRRQALALDTRDSDCLSFPTLTSNDRSTSRPAGQTKCEKWFKDNGLIAPGYQLSAEAMALIMGFPKDWFSPLSPPIPQDASEPDISQDEQLLQDKQRSPSEESSISIQLLGGDENSPLQKDKKRLSPSRDISIPCLVKQPGQPELKGLIREERGDRFIVYIPDSDSTITVSKLFVYPDFSKLDKSSSKQTPPSKNCSRKSRRKKGEGSGAIFYRTVTKNGRDYQEAYYHWQENGKQRSKYIPKKLLDKVKQAESLKLPVSDILVLLVGTGKCSRKKSDTSIISPDTKVIDSEDKCSRKTIPTSKKRRQKGYGSGWIQCKPIKRSGKEYKQYWYCYEEWQSGDRVTKKSRYIPKRLLAKVEKMNNEKVPVEEILRVLRNRSKRKK